MAERMSTITHIETYLRTYLDRTYRESAWKTVTEQPSDIWPKRVRIFRANQAWSLQHVAEVRDWVHEIFEYIKNNQIPYETITFELPAKIDIPTYIIINNAHIASDLIRNRWPQDAKRYPTLESRLNTLLNTFDTDAINRVHDVGLWRIDNQTDIDFELICDAAIYIANHDVNGLTPRQIPIPGFSSKWLNATRLSVICAIINQNIHLNNRPAQIDFKYLDPTHITQGNRQFDSYVQGDTPNIAYTPDTIIIVENLDNMRYYPPTINKGICIFGQGYNVVKLIAPIDWVKACNNVFYWGDIDEDGFKILNTLRKELPQVQSLNMNTDTYKTYQKYGTNVTDKSATIYRTSAVHAKEVADSCEYLTENEKTTLKYCLANGSVRRIEQERIPFPTKL